MNLILIYSSILSIFNKINTMNHLRNTKQNINNVMACLQKLLAGISMY